MASSSKRFRLTMAKDSFRCWRLADFLRLCISLRLLKGFLQFLNGTTSHGEGFKRKKARRRLILKEEKISLDRNL
ncbi:hypothetical protein Tco_0920521, partial [Tanacetum coccineum]